MVLLIKKELAICPRCESDKVYIILSLGQEEEISCAKCGFVGEPLEK